MKIAVYCEAPGKLSFELLGKARELGDEVVALCLDSDASPYHAHGADLVFSMEACGDDCAQGTRLAAALLAIKPDAVLFPATVRGRFLSAWSAAKLKTGLTADCTDLRISDEGLLEQIRPAYGGNLIAHIICGKARPQMASVRPGAFPFEAKPVIPGAKASVPLPAVPVAELLEKLDHVPADRGGRLQEAEIIVAGGLGIGGRKGFDKLFELAGLMGGALGATRSAVDAGYVSYEHQIGQTGLIVRPRLYLGFAISGLLQHIVGINSSQTIVAINTDSSAPIFRYADYGVAEDWETVADSLIKHYKERKSKR